MNVLATFRGEANVHLCAFLHCCVLKHWEFRTGIPLSMIFSRKETVYISTHPEKALYQTNLLSLNYLPTITCPYSNLNYSSVYRAQTNHSPLVVNLKPPVVEKEPSEAKLYPNEEQTEPILGEEIHVMLWFTAAWQISVVLIS